MEQQITGDGFTLQFKKPFRLLAGTGILFAGSLFIYVTLTHQLSLLLSILVFVPILKMLQSIWLFKIKVDSKNKTICFARSLGQNYFSLNEIESWTIKKINNDSIESSSQAKRRHIEVRTKFSKKFTYPIPTQKSIIPYVLWSDNELEALFTPTIGTPKSTQPISSLGIRSLKYDLNFFLI